MSNGPLIFAFLVAGFVGVVFAGLWRLNTARDPTDSRLKQVGDLAAPGEIPAKGGAKRKNSSLATKLVNGFGVGPSLAKALSAANLSVTATEYALIILLVAVLGFALGWSRGGLLLGLAVGAVCAYAPLFYLTNRTKRRKIAFENQLPEVLTMMVGALRAGHGISQTMVDLTEQMPPPASEEFGKVVRSINLGASLSAALNDLADRMNTKDVELVVTAIVIQSELGGNLATTLETISDTIRDRIRMKREIRVLTSQQRLTGIVLAITPIALALIISLLNPGYMKPFFEPGWIRILPIGALILEAIGFLVINKIMDIEV